MKKILLITLTLLMINCGFSQVKVNSLKKTKNENLLPDKQKKVLYSNNSKNGINPQIIDFKSKLFFVGSLGYQSYKWMPTVPENSPILFNTEGLKSFSIFTDIGFDNRHLISFSYNGLFKYTKAQKEMLQTNNSSEKGVEKYIFGLNLAPIVNSIIDDNKLFKKIFRTFLSVRFKQSRTLFYGSIRGISDFYYIPLGSSLTFESPIEDIPLYLQGSNLSFKTLFVENEIIIPLFSVEYVQGRDISHFFNLGLYSNSYKRPALFFHYNFDETPLIMEQSFISKGIYFGLQTIERSYPGLNLDWKLYSGKRQSDISTWNTSINEYYKNNENKEIASSGLAIQMWYNHYFKKTNNCLTVGFLSDAFSWTLIDMSAESSDVITIEQDVRVTYYIRYLFKL